MPLLILRQPASKYASVGGSSIVDDVNYNYTSSVSVSAFPTQEFLGGATGDMMSLGLGSTFAKTGWEKLSGSSVCDWKGSNVRTRGRSKSFLFDAVANGETQDNARGTYGRDTGASGYDRLYYRGLYYWDINVSWANAQFKMFRHNCRTDWTGGSGPEVEDGNPPQAYWSNSNVRDNMPFSQFTADVSSWVHGNAYTQAAFNTGPPDFIAFPQNQWCLLEHFFQENSSTSISDGIGRVKITLANGTTFIDTTTSDRRYRGTNDYSKAAQPFRYFVMQNYFGNAGFPDNSLNYGDTKLYMSDQMIVPAPAGGANPYIRCEINDGAGEPVIQPWVLAGCSGTARRIKPNLGRLSTFSGCTLREYDASNAVVHTAVL